MRLTAQERMDLGEGWSVPGGRRPIRISDGPRAGDLTGTPTGIVLSQELAEKVGAISSRFIPALGAERVFNDVAGAGLFAQARIRNTGDSRFMSDSLFEKLGGEPAVDAAVDLFYRKVLTDDRISKFFETVDMDGQRAKQKAFLTMAFGGPHSYTGKDMRDAHAHLVAQGLNDSHFDAVVEDLAAALQEMGVAAELIAQVGAVAETTRNDVLGK